MVRGDCDFVEVVESSHMQFEFFQRQVVVLRLVLVAELIRLCQIPLHLARQPALHTITSRLKYIIRRRPSPPAPPPAAPRLPPQGAGGWEVGVRRAAGLSGGGG